MTEVSPINRRLTGLDVQLLREVLGGRISVAKKWIALGANVHLQTTQGTLLSALCVQLKENFDAKMAQMLVDHGASLNGGDGQPIPLLVATGANNVAAVNWLLHSRANTTVTNLRGESVLRHAASNGAIGAGLKLFQHIEDRAWVESQALGALSVLRITGEGGSTKASETFAIELWEAAVREAHRNKREASVAHAALSNCLNAAFSAVSVRFLTTSRTTLPDCIWQSVGLNLVATESIEALDQLLKNAPPDVCATLWEQIPTAWHARMPAGLERFAQHEARAIAIEVGGEWSGRSPSRRL